ncbi:Gfo/Idh/MocA family protein [Halomicrobium sp. LC1Hm]|uniref:Gfo/Idh/MocA family protein n=1 Tax=Halomicrobium sp. LC1Hm TaxID=2610902 RepID=UPI00129824A8|nr:Gfo/Idh/MocA family oxidoreductase [Halomicrobium sp. LC1Hm]QGA82418.1 Oxidoreductase [Halomicrobium sp. LC1Hm]
MSENGSLRTGVVGVGNMGRHHARVYAQNRAVSLVGIADADEATAREVADDYDTTAMSTDELLDVVDAVTIAVPTRYHDDLVGRALDAGVHVLVEKPFVKDLADGEALVERAAAENLVLQVGHIERFNPAIRTLTEVLADHEVLAVEARRLGPPVDRDTTDTVTMDLMVHDLDVTLSLLDSGVRSVDAAGTCNGQHVTAQLSFEDDTVAQFSASRVTQQKVRQLAVTTRDARITVDYADQDVRIHRHSVPAYVENDGDVRYRHESVIEQPTVANGEPLVTELDAFVEAVVTDSEPVVSGTDGLRALELIDEIDAQVSTELDATAQQSR